MPNGPASTLQITRIRASLVNRPPSMTQPGALIPSGGTRNSCSSRSVFSSHRVAVISLAENTGPNGVETDAVARALGTRSSRADRGAAAGERSRSQTVLAGPALPFMTLGTAAPTNAAGRTGGSSQSSKRSCCAKVVSAGDTAWRGTSGLGARLA